MHPVRSSRCTDATHMLLMHSPRYLTWLTLAAVFAGFLLRFLLGPFWYPFSVLQEPPATFATVFLARYPAPQSPLPYQPGAWPDDVVYADAGWYYLHGLSPHLFNFEHPPVAKYLIGLSLALTGNPNVFSLLFGLATLLGAYAVGAAWFGAARGGMLTALLLSVDKMFVVLSAAVMLEIYTASFIVWSFWAVLRLGRSRRSAYLAGGLLGLAVGTKWTAMLYAVALLAWILLARRSWLRPILTRTLPLAVVVYVASYAMYFAQGHGLGEWLGLQTQILSFQSELRYRPILAPPYLALLTLVAGVQWLPVTVTWTAPAGVAQSQIGLPLEPSYNPMLWPLLAMAAATLLVTDVRIRRWDRLILPLGLFIVYAGLRNAYWFYALPVFVFGVLSVVTWLMSLPRAWGRPVVVAYMLLVIMWSVYYPYFIPL